MKTLFYSSLALAAALSLATAAEDKSSKSLSERTGDALSKAGETAKDTGRAVIDTTKAAGRALADSTKKATDKAIELITPDADAHKVDVKLSENRLDMPMTLKSGKTGFVVHNSGTERHNFEIQGEGIEKKFLIGIGPDETKVLHVDLKPGTYKAFCPEKGSHHEGMSTTLTVQ